MDIISRDDGSAEVKNNITSAKKNWFVDLKNGDLHLTEQAIDVIDKAVPVKYISNDFDEQKRPIGMYADIGADEIEY